MTITEQPGPKKPKHARPAPTLPFLLRYRDLVDAGIVSSWMQVGRLIANQGFPTGVMLSANIRAWPADEVNAWLESRPTAKKPVPGRASTPTEAA